jgi:hypothetical protein
MNAPLISIGSSSPVWGCSRIARVSGPSPSLSKRAIV